MKYLLVPVVLATLIFTSLDAAASTLAPNLLHKILNAISAVGADKDVPAIIANGLGLSAAGQPWPSRQIVATNTTLGTMHGISISRGSEQDIVITVRNPDNIRIFRAHRDGTLVAAVIYDLRTNKLITRDRGGAETELDRQFAYWTDELPDNK